MKNLLVATGTLVLIGLAAAPRSAHACGPLSIFGPIDRLIAKLSLQASPQIKTALVASRCSMVEVLLDLQRTAGEKEVFLDKVMQGFVDSFVVFLGKVDVSKASQGKLLGELAQQARASFLAAAKANDAPPSVPRGARSTDSATQLTRQFNKGIRAMWHWIHRNHKQPAEWFTTERVQAAAKLLLSKSTGHKVPVIDGARQ